MIPPQQLIVTCEPPDAIATFWEQMSDAAPGVFNAWFVIAPGNGQDD